MAKRESCTLILIKMAFLLILLIGTLIAGYHFINERLKEFFNRGETIEIPDFRGQHLVKVFKEKPADLVLEKRDEKHDARYPKDHVVAQYPEPGTRVRANKKVYLTISLGNKQVKVPELVQRTLRDVDLELQNAQLAHGNRVYLSSDKVAKDRVAAQSPLPGDTHTIMGGVDLIVSLGPSQRRVPLPNLIGKNLDQAKNSLTAWGLRLGRILSKPDPGRPGVEILSTDPPPYQPVSEGTVVDLLVSAGTSPGNVTAKDLRLFEFHKDMSLSGKNISQSDRPTSANKPEPPRIMVGQGELVQPGRNTVVPPPQSQTPLQADTTGTQGEQQTTMISFLMPDGFMPKEVKFIQVSSSGREQIYAATHKPNDLIKVNAPKISGSKVHIYINNVPIEERSID